jgi:hypothetical protein
MLGRHCEEEPKRRVSSVYALIRHRWAYRTYHDLSSLDHHRHLICSVQGPWHVTVTWRVRVDQSGHAEERAGRRMICRPATRSGLSTWQSEFLFQVVMDTSSEIQSAVKSSCRKPETNYLCRSRPSLVPQEFCKFFHILRHIESLDVCMKY